MDTILSPVKSYVAKKLFKLDKSLRKKARWSKEDFASDDRVYTDNYSFLYLSNSVFVLATFGFGKASPGYKSLKASDFGQWSLHSVVNEESWYPVIEHGGACRVVDNSKTVINEHKNKVIHNWLKEIEKGNHLPLDNMHNIYINFRKHMIAFDNDRMFDLGYWEHIVDFMYDIYNLGTGNKRVVKSVGNPMFVVPNSKYALFFTDGLEKEPSDGELKVFVALAGIVFK